MPEEWQRQNNPRVPGLVRPGQSEADLPSPDNELHDEIGEWLRDQRRGDSGLVS